MKEKDAEIISKKIKKCTDKTLIKKWDKCLDDYNNYLKEYIKQYKKSLKGNFISLLKYPYLKAKSEAIYERLYDAQNKALLTKKQIKRIAKIQSQIANPCLT
ncbi:MAG: hypothetical protein C0412_17410 [Flavobacterium sp.]|jgi:hypothetical protein|nr:hypothetical protein [Flavobacterium sp.]